MAEAVEAYATRIGRQSGRPQSEAFERAALKPLVEACAPGMLVAMLTARHVDAYLSAVAGLSLASQRSYWKALVRFAAWLEVRGLVMRNVAADCLTRRARRDDPLPWHTRAGSRRIGRGKPQLRNLHEVGLYLGAAGNLHDPAYRVAASLPVLTGMASGEVLNLRAGAVDFDARKIWVRSDDASDGDWTVKTGNRERTLDLPDALEADLRALVADKVPTAYVFPRGPRFAFGEHGVDGLPHGRHWLADLVRRVCEAAGVRVVPPHGLRGTHTSMRLALATRRISQIGDVDTLKAIARDLGHADDGETARRHYKGAPEHVPALRMVVGGGPGEVFPAVSPAPAGSDGSKTMDRNR